MSHDHDHHHHDHDHHAHAPADDMAEILDLDAEVLHDLLSDLTSWTSDHAGDPRRILDLGSGTGTGTFALLDRFPDAEVLAVDAEEPMIQRLEAKARTLGLADRVTTIRADLDSTWPETGQVDLVWASASLHHMADPIKTLTRIKTALRPGGLLAVIELDGFPRFLPDDLGDGLEGRIHAALAENHATRMPHLGSDWATQLTAAGYTVEAERVFTADLQPPLPAATPYYAWSLLNRLRTHLSDRLTPADLAFLENLLHQGLDPDTLTVKATRTAWLARP